MKIFQLITFSQSFRFDQSFYNTAKELVEDMENILSDFPSLESEILEFISEVSEQSIEEDAIVGMKREFEDRSFVRIELIDTDEICEMIPE